MVYIPLSGPIGITLLLHMVYSTPELCTCVDSRAPSEVRKPTDTYSTLYITIITPHLICVRDAFLRNGVYCVLRHVYSEFPGARNVSSYNKFTLLRKRVPCATINE